MGTLLTLSRSNPVEPKWVLYSRSLFSIFASTASRGFEASYRVGCAAAGQAPAGRGMRGSSEPGAPAPSKGVCLLLLASLSSLVQEKVNARADNREPCVAATGSLTLNFWTPYSMKLYITPSLAPQDVCERCSQEYSSSPTGETLCYVKIAAFSPYLRGS